MELATPHPEQNDVRGKLEEGISPYSHKREYPQRQQRHGHNHDLCGDRQVHPHQFRVAHKQEQKHSLYRVAGLQHAAQQLPGIGVVGRNCIDIAELSVIHWCRPPPHQELLGQDRPPGQHHSCGGTGSHSQVS